MRVYRKLFPTEAPRLRDHLLRLDRVDRHRRFFAGMSDAAIDEHCRRIDWLRMLVIGFFEDGVLRGAAEVALDGGLLPRQAELALSIEGPWQDRGIGTELMRRAILTASNRAVPSIYMLCLSDNRRMQSIAKKFDARLGFADGEADARLDVPPPTQLSLATEALGDGFGLFALWWDAASPRAAAA
jgi:RimJ/RimL family protein N-acetyltransferase